MKLLVWVLTLEPQFPFGLKTYMPTTKLDRHPNLEQVSLIVVRGKGQPQFEIKGVVTSMWKLVDTSALSACMSQPFANPFQPFPT